MVGNSLMVLKGFCVACMRGTAYSPLAHRAIGSGLGCALIVRPAVPMVILAGLQSTAEICLAECVAAS
jgi:hypothetical protein